ncbi:hypothetical protein BCY84_01329 [Trypanosoma cruzi cruzi]|nr:hypothetical protein BCY84_01329 [Trypanosoma cruzi cruzi]PWU94283.1 hypothetical protein C4B63_27g192 [Trypanosoma cruzi]
MKEGKGKGKGPAKYKKMERCRGKCSRECLVQLQVVTPQKLGGNEAGEAVLSSSLDMSALCEAIGHKMSVFCGLAVEASAAGLQVEAVRHDTDGVYHVVLRLLQATPLAVTALRASCASTALGPVVGGARRTVRQKNPRQEETAVTTPVAVRVVHLTAVKAA